MSGARTWYALLALGSAAFTAVGSLVPFDFQSLPPGAAADLFARCMVERLWPHSKSDAVANVLLGVPLGFALLGTLCAGRRVPWWRAALYGIVLLPACGAFAAAVEFVQLYAPGRYCSGSDVVAQLLGAAAGMTAWLLCGERVTAEVRKTVTAADPAARLLVGYVVFFGFVQALPLDLSLSPVEAYRKFRDGGVNPVPFREFRELTGNDTLDRVATLLQVAGLYLPVGLLAAHVPGRFWRAENFARVLLAAVALAVTLELGQVLVRSRTSSATDAVVGAAAAFTGWALVLALPRGSLLLGAVWWAVLVWVSWVPFETGPPVAFDWVPAAPLEAGNPLFALEAMLTKLVLFGLGGALFVAALDTPRQARLSVAAALGLLAAALLELGQTRFAGHSPGITDVLLGGLGAACGAWTAARVRRGREWLRGATPQAA